MLALILPLVQVQSASAGKKSGDPGARRGGLAKAMEKAKRMQAPFKPHPYESGGSWKEGPITIYRTGKADGPAPLRFLWFHGAGQGPENELVTRLANASHEVGLNLEIVSMPYNDGIELSRDLVLESPGKVLVGGHSMGGMPSRFLASVMTEKVAGVVTVNAVEHAMVPGVPALHFLGENDGGSRFLGRKFAWGDRDVHVFKADEKGEHRGAVVREADHSARWRAWNDHDKEKASETEDTKRLSIEMAKTIKTFLQDNKIEN